MAYKFKFEEKKVVELSTENQVQLRWVERRIASVKTAIGNDQTDLTIPLKTEAAEATLKRFAVAREDILSKMSKDEIAEYNAVMNPVELSDEEAQAEREALTKRLNQNKDKPSH